MQVLEEDIRAPCLPKKHSWHQEHINTAIVKAPQTSQSRSKLQVVKFLLSTATLGVANEKIKCMLV